MRYQLAIFDMDGTILNTLQDLTNSLNAALQLSGYPQHTLEEVRFFVGNGIRKLIERGVPAGTPVAQIDKVHQDFTEHYRVHCADTTQPYAGIPELLHQLRNAGCKTAVVSNNHFFENDFNCPTCFNNSIRNQISCFRIKLISSINPFTNTIKFCSCILYHLYKFTIHK